MTRPRPITVLAVLNFAAVAFILFFLITDFLRRSFPSSWMYSLEV